MNLFYGFLLNNPLLEKVEQNYIRDGMRFIKMWLLMNDTHPSYN